MSEWWAQRGGRGAWAARRAAGNPGMLLCPGARSHLLPDSQGPAAPAPHPWAGRHRADVLQAAPGAVGKPAALEPGGRSDWFAPGTDVRARSPNTSCPGPAELALLGTALLAWPCRSSEPSPALIPAHGRQNLPGKCGRLPAWGRGVLRGSMDALPSGFGGGTGLSLLLSGVFLHSSRREKEPEELPGELLPPAPLGTWREGSQQHRWCQPRAGRGVKALGYFATLEL